VSRAGVSEGLALHAVERKGKGKGKGFRCRKYNWLDEGPAFLAFCQMKI
jgi:stalled ribosome alternative rescue factor ArfA